MVSCVTCAWCASRVLHAWWQVREQLWGAYWAQWLADTGTLLQKLPVELSTPEPGSLLLLTFERWLLQLKVRCSSRMHE